MLDAMRDMIAQNFLLDAAQRRAHRGDLRDDVDAVAVLVDHLRQAADLALDPAQALLQGCLDVLPHAAYIPLQGIGFKIGAFDERSRTFADGRNEVLLQRASRACGPRSPSRRSWRHRAARAR